MTQLKYLGKLFVIFALISCGQSADNYSSFVPGTWAGYAQTSAGQGKDLVMYVSFRDGILTVDYSPRGGVKRTAPYSFRNGRTIETSLYPENLIIDALPGGRLRFRPEGEKVRVFIEMIYQCDFARVGK